jgi:hypothetical protein
MSTVMRRIAPRHVVFALVVSGVGIFAAATARAGDLAPPVYAPYPAPGYGGGYERAAPCHIVLDRRFDPYGRQTVQRVRVCDAAPMYPPVAGPVVAPEYGYPAPRYDEPEPSGYDGYPPRPPVPVGPRYYN